MWSTILPELMSITVFILTILCLQAGHSPSYLQNYAILSLNTTGLKSAYHERTQAGLPIHDVYNLYMMTTCSGYWTNNSAPPPALVTCSPVSWYSKFLPATLIQTDLTSHHGANLSSLSFPPSIQSAFVERFNLQLHVAFIFYVIALVWVGIVIVWGMLACWVGVLGSFAVLFTSSASTSLLIASAIVSVVQSQAVALINDQGANIGLSAGYNGRFLALTWSAFAINCVSSVVWSLSGFCSGLVRGRGDF
ncbi:uncharacterized protein K444DRAFT_662830 [Hyaloscypha bicolor E]|uniref:SUR7-domain-containing protein n=1 Tax=Hyaloscypha bicolor E TaxID=1095630 RepID=A0A2J6TCS7_9HELO|nr:uncharacterized protein K444DRAFT_662830 [Hyaloscypha bicolor E]PMD60826.1 hypothetical protein K444DRAFT_662830 [Hyaloscypha bicolor E]